MDPYTDSDSDNDAPEEVSLSTARQSTKLAAQRAAENQAKLKQAAKDKNRSKDAKSKASKGKARAEQAAAAAVAAQLAEEEDEEDYKEDSEEEEEVAASPVASGSKHTHLDPALFAAAAAHYEPAPQALAGQGKRAAKLAARQAKREERARVEQRRAEIGEGGQRTVGGTTIQHLPSAGAKQASLASTALGSHTSATKFLTNRLYSQKRLVQLVNASAPKDKAPSARKRGPKTGKKGGMSDESRRLLGLPVAGDKGNKRDDDDSEDEVELGRVKKRAMLLKGEGKRTSAGLARPLASTRGARPAANFAVATRTR